MAYELLLREGRINSMYMRNRLIAGPMEKAMANQDGSLTQAYIDYLAERAKGGVALSTIESTYVDTRGRGFRFQVGLHADHVIPNFRLAADAVHASGGKLGVQIMFGGRVTSSLGSRRQPMAPSAIPCEANDPMPVPREMTLPEIDEIVGKFAEAAARAIEIGLDMVLVHGAHGYLLGAFLSPFTNKRTDEYGGSLEGRARLALQVLAAVREVVGPDFPIGYRMSADEYVDGGLTVADTAEFAKLLADAGIDLIDVAGGIYESTEMIVQGPEAPKGGFVRNAQAIKAAVGDRVPVSVVQRLNDPDFANEVLGSGLDYITLSRAFHADPYYVQKLADAKADEIIPCIACYHCARLLIAGEQAGCAVNPATSFERRRRPRPAAEPGRVVVVGGGPGGLQSARILAGQGHSVVLFEQHEALGGQVLYSSRVAPDYENFVTYLEGQMVKLGVDVRLGAAAGLETVLDESPDAVVVATGAVGGLWFCPVVGEPTTFDLFSAFDRDQDAWEEEKVVVIGGDGESCVLALDIAGRGGEVHIVEPGKEFAYNRFAQEHGRVLEELERLPTIHLYPETTAEEVGEGYVVFQSRGSNVRMDGIDSVVIGDRTALHTLYEELVLAQPELDLHLIGDAVKPRGMYTATHEAADAAELIRLRTRGRARDTVS